MISDKLGKQLHHKFSLGETLSPKENKQLEAWYKYHDEQEMATLQVQKLQFPFSDLQAKIEATLSSLVELTHHIQQITTDNKKIREQNNFLLNQLSKSIKKSA